MKRLVVSLMAALALGAFATTAFAIGSVGQTVIAGTRTATVAPVTLTQMTTTHAAQLSTGTMALTVDDSIGSGAGWNVTILSSDFVYSGANNGTDIAANTFTLVSAADPAMTAGQAVATGGSDGAPTGPQLGTIAGVTGTLEAAIKVIRAGATYGQGTYTQNLPVSLAIPADVRAGTYTGTLTVTITAGP